VTLNNDDISLKMIKAGQAWWFKRYADTQSLSDRLIYSQAEDQSRRQQLGLWADPNPVPPWTYRHEQQQRQ
jgi:endonuclease YncB( thermonuclease family)